MISNESFSEIGDTADFADTRIEQTQPSGIVERTVPTPRGSGFVRLGTIAQILGKEDADVVLGKLAENDMRHREALQRLGFTSRRGY